MTEELPNRNYRFILAALERLGYQCDSLFSPQLCHNYTYINPRYRPEHPGNNEFNLCFSSEDSICKVNYFHTDWTERRIPKAGTCSYLISDGRKPESQSEKTNETERIPTPLLNQIVGRVLDASAKAELERGAMKGAVEAFKGIWEI